MNADNVIWLGHACFRFETNGMNIYVDPFKIDKEPKADIILITHNHYDHCSPDDIKKIVGPKTEIVATPDCHGQLEPICSNLHDVQPGSMLKLHGITIEAIPAYNIGKKFHPKENKWVGYVIDIDGFKIYHTGDTDVIPEMKEITVDLALLPVGGTYTMTAMEAANAFEMMTAKKAIPMHYASIVGTEQDAQEFKKLIKE